MAGLIVTGSPLSSSFDELTHTYRDESGRLIPSVSSVIQPLTQAAYRTIDPEILRRAADFGSAVHACTEFFDNGELDDDSVEEEWRPFLNAYKLFKVEMKPEIVRVEWRLACERYAGTIDRLMIIDGVEWIVDLKTTSQIHDHVGLQLAAYEALARLHLKEKKQLKRAALQLKGDGTYRFVEFTEDSDYACFNALIGVKNWREKHGY